MPNCDINNLDSLLNKLIADKKAPKKILIGYKTYGELMNDRRFLEEVVGSAMDPNKRKYKKVKIKITQDEYLLEVKCSD